MNVRRSKSKRFLRWHVSYADSRELKGPVGQAENRRPPGGGMKKRRPPGGGLESREETPKEGMRGNRRTRASLAPNAANASTRCTFATTCWSLRRFCNSEDLSFFVAAQDIALYSTQWRAGQNPGGFACNKETCLLCKKR
jgi:hypothetical protein